jgi:hypothetical protein
MRKLTPAEARFIRSVVKENIRILYSRNRRNPNGRRMIPTRVEIRPNEARIMVRLNSFIGNAINWMGKKLRPQSQERAHLRIRLLHLRDLNRSIRAILGRPGRTASYFVTGQEAEVYFNTLELAHKAFPAIRMNYIESARDIKEADRTAKEAWWAIRSIINVGHLPVEKTRF